MTPVERPSPAPSGSGSDSWTPQRFQASSKFRRALLVSAIAIGLTYALVYPAVSVDDTLSYLEPARSFAAGRGLRDISGGPLDYRLPAYPLVLGTAIFLFGESALLFSLVNLACHVCGVLLVRRALHRYDGWILDGVSSAAIVYPPLLTSTGMILQESLLSCLLALVFLGWWRALESPSTSRSLLAGAALGLACLAKVVALPLTLPLAFLMSRAREPSIRRAIAALMGAGLVLLPWAVRNSIVLGRFEVTNNNGGLALLGGTSSNVVEWNDLPELAMEREKWDRRGEARPMPDRYLYLAAFDRIRAQPLRWLRLVLERALRFMLPARHWFLTTGRSRDGSLSPFYLMALGVQAVLFGSSGLLLVRGWRGREWTLLVGPLIVFSHQLVYAIFYSSPRYGVSVGPVLFGGLALVLHQWMGPATPGSRQVA